MKKLLYLSDLYNFYVSQNKNVKFNSKDSDATIVIHVDEPFIYSKSEDDDLNLFAPIRLCHTEENVNKSSISEKAMKDAMNTAYEMPVLGYIYPDPNNEDQLTFAGHEFFVNEDNEIIYEEAPVGVISNNQKLELVYDEESGKTYLEGLAKIWRTYTKAADILEREKKFWCSVELCVDELSFDSKSKLLIIDKFRFSGVTILGKSREDGSEIKPGMVGSNISITDFSVENNSVFSQNEKIIKLLSELTEKIDGLNIDLNSERKEDTEKPMKKKFEELTEEEIKDSPSTEVFDDNDGDGGDSVDYYDDPSDTEGDDTTEGSDITEGGDNAEGGDTVEGGDNAEGGNTTESGDGEGGGSMDPNTGYDVDPSGDDPSGDDPDPSGDDPSGDDDDDGEVIISDDEPSKKKKKTDGYSVDYTISVNGEKKDFSVSLKEKLNALTILVNDTYGESDGAWYDCDVIEETKMVEFHDWWANKHYRQSYSVKKDVYSLKGDRIETYVSFLSADEKTALEQMKANYSSIVDELASFKAEPDKEEILAKDCYKKIAEVDAFKELCKKENHFSMSVEEVEVEADKILLEYAKGNEIKFSAEDSEKKSVGVKLFGNPTKKVTKGSSRYGGLFSK